MMPSPGRRATPPTELFQNSLPSEVAWPCVQVMASSTHGSTGCCCLIRWALVAIPTRAFRSAFPFLLVLVWLHLLLLRVLCLWTCPSPCWLDSVAPCRKVSLFEILCTPSRTRLSRRVI